MRLRIGTVNRISVIWSGGCVTSAMQQDAARVRVLEPRSGEVFSTNHWTQSGGCSTTAAEAVAAMNENIAKQIGAAPKAQNPEQHASAS